MAEAARGRDPDFPRGLPPRERAPEEVFSDGANAGRWDPHVGPCGMGGPRPGVWGRHLVGA
eukprot:11225755-Lingulodinium_polyedra.AAC.1